MPEDKARKRAVRARMAETGERYTTAARRLIDTAYGEPLAVPPGYSCPECAGVDLSAERTGTDSARVTCRDCGNSEIRPAVPPADPAYAALAQGDPPLAEREWWTRARVRILSTYPGGQRDIWGNRERPPQPGEELQMIQWGREGRPVDRDAWWTSTDIDGAVIIPAGHVLVLEVTEVRAPTHKGAAMPAAEVAAMFGPGASGWAEQGVLVIAGLFDFEIRASSGELLGLIERGGRGDTYNPPHPREPVTYRAVIHEGAEAWPAPAAVKFPAGFVPPDPARATAGERARWAGQAREQPPG